MKLIKSVFFLLLMISCNNKKSNQGVFKIQNYDVVNDVISSNGIRKIELKNKIRPFKIVIDSIKDESVILTFYDEKGIITMMNKFQNDSLYFYPFIDGEFRMVGKGKVKLIIDTVDIFYKGWIKSIHKNEFDYFDGNIHSAHGVNITQYIKYDSFGIIEKESYYYQILENTKDEIKFDFSTITENNSEILKTISYLTMIDNSQGYLKRIDSIEINSGNNTIKKSFLKRYEKYNPYLETNNYLKNGKIETIVFIPFDTIIIPIPK